MTFGIRYDENIRKDLACAKFLRGAGESLCRSYSSQKKLILFINTKKTALKKMPQRLNLSLEFFRRFHQQRIANFLGSSENRKSLRVQLG